MEGKSLSVIKIVYLLMLSFAKRVNNEILKVKTLESSKIQQLDWTALKIYIVVELLRLERVRENEKQKNSEYKFCSETTWKILMSRSSDFSTRKLNFWLDNGDASHVDIIMFTIRM